MLISLASILSFAWRLFHIQACFERQILCSFSFVIKRMIFKMVGCVPFLVVCFVVFFYFHLYFVFLNFWLFKKIHLIGGFHCLGYKIQSLALILDDPFLFFLRLYIFKLFTPFHSQILIRSKHLMTHMVSWNLPMFNMDPIC